MKVYQIIYCDEYGNAIIETCNLLEHIKSVIDLTCRGDIDFVVKVIEK